MSCKFWYRDGGIIAQHQVDASPRPDEFRMHAHESHELFFLLSGQGRYAVEGTEYPLSPGCVLLMRAGETHCPHVSAGQVYERITVEFRPSVLDAVDPGGLLQKPYLERPLGARNLYLPGAVSEPALAAYETAFRKAEEADYSEEEKRLLVVASLGQLLFELLRCFLHQKEDAGHTADEAVRGVIAYINSHLTEPYSLETLSERFFLSRSQLNKKFRQVTGSTVWEYTLVKRLLLARGLIRGGARAAQTAAACGWNDYSAFYRQYRARFGVSPANDRQGPPA